SLTSSAYVALCALVGTLLWQEDHPIWSSIGLAALWGLTEYLRSMWPLGGFTWGGLGYSQVGNGFLLPLASITGVWGVSSVVLLVDAFLLLALERLRRQPAMSAMLAGVSGRGAAARAHADPRAQRQARRRRHRPGQPLRPAHPDHGEHPGH